MRSIINRLLYGLAAFISTFLLLGMGRALALTGAYPASDTIGQTDDQGNPVFDTEYSQNHKVTLDASGLTYPVGTALDTVHHRLFTADCDDNRVLVYNLDSHNNLLDRNADHVLGQDNFSSDDTSTAQDGLWCPAGPSYDPVHDRLFVLDDGNNRIMIWDLSGGITDGMNAVSEFGQADWNLNQYNRGGSTAANTISNPWSSTAYDAEHNWLYVDDNGNNRVLVYDVSTTTKGKNALYALGQPTTSDNTADTDQNSLNSPYSLVYDDDHQRLFVGDSGNNRVVVYDMSGDVHTGMDASWLIGAEGWTDQNNATGQNRFIYTLSLAYDPVNQRLFVTDDNSYRILIFDVASIGTDENAVAILASTEYITENNCNPVTSSNICYPEGNMAFDPTNNRLWYTDSSHARILVYEFAHFTNTPGAIAGGTIGSKYNFGFNVDDGQCDQTVTKSGGSLPPGLRLSSSGKVTGTPTKPGKYRFELNVADDCGAIGTFGQDPAYSITVLPGAPNTSGLTSSNNLGIWVSAVGTVVLIGGLLTINKQWR